jgi:hypothetical protein
LFHHSFQAELEDMTSAYYWHGNMLERVYLVDLEFRGIAFLNPSYVRQIQRIGVILLRHIALLVIKAGKRFNLAPSTT